MAYGGLPFPDTGCPVPDVYFYYVSDMINAWILFLHVSISLSCFANGNSFWTTEDMIYNMPISF